MAKYSTIIAQELRLSAEELDKLKISALLHDVGKIGVDDRVLKKPGSLTPEEFEIMKTHTTKGDNIMVPARSSKICCLESNCTTSIWMAAGILMVCLGRRFR